MFSKTKFIGPYSDGKSDCKSFLLFLEKKYGVLSDYLLDMNSSLRCIYFQDLYMKDVFNFFPDRFCLDITYKFSETNVFMYSFLAEDSNGRYYVVSFGFSISEDSESLIWLLSTFKKHNPNWRRTKIIAIDSDIKSKDIIRSFFPNPYIVICFHHAYKSFKRGLDQAKMQNVVPTDQFQIALELFKNMYLAQNQVEYELYYQQFLLLHGLIVSYFQEIWMPLLYLWRTGLDFYHENIFSSLNLYLEYFDHTFKSLFISENNILEFIKKSFLILSLKRSEKLNMTSHTESVWFSRFSPEYHISKFLTPYAAKFVIAQFDFSSEIHMDCSIISDNYFFDNFGVPVSSSATICSCHFFLYTYLPCRHIFAVRRTLSFPVFDESLIDSCWSMKYYQNASISIHGSLVTLKENFVPSSLMPKHTMVSCMLQSTLPVLFKTSDLMFDSKIDTLNQLVNLWKNNTDVYLQYYGVEKKFPVLKTNNSGNCFDQESFPVITSDICNPESPIFVPYPDLLEKETTLSNQSDCDMIFKQSKWNFKSRVLDGRHINYSYLCRIICETKEGCLDWLRQMELIPSTMMCPSCNCEMMIKTISRLSDGAVWVCPNIMENKRNCSRRCSVRQGSWFELTNMPFDQILTFCYMWINGFSQSQIISETGVSSATYISWNKLNNRVCEEVLFEEGTISTRADSCNQVLEMWLKCCGDEDTFLKFLQDANAMHRKDSIRRIMH